MPKLIKSKKGSFLTVFPKQVAVADGLTTKTKFGFRRVGDGEYMLYVLKD